MLDVLLDALLDTLKMLPFLFGAYVLIEYLEHKASKKMKHKLMHLGPFGPIGGALLGVVPQCGFSVTAANFYSGKIITMGTLVAVFLSTSDEAIPILISHPESFGYLWKMIVIKVLVAIVSGIGIDLVYRFVCHKKEEAHFEEICDHCDCNHHGIFRSACRHTIETILFIFAINLVLGALIYWIGEDTIGAFLLQDTIFQPFLAGLIGFIPNCASSVILTELFTEGALSFGSTVAGLCAGAGIGLAVLFRTNKHPKQNFLILGLLYVISVGTGLLTDWIIV